MVSLRKCQLGKDLNKVKEWTLWCGAKERVPGRGKSKSKGLGVGTGWPVQMVWVGWGEQGQVLRYQAVKSCGGAGLLWSLLHCLSWEGRHILEKVMNSLFWVEKYIQSCLLTKDVETFKRTAVFERISSVWVMFFIPCSFFFPLLCLSCVWAKR